MGIISALTKVGIAKKIYNEARKPENQRKAKAAFAKLQDRSKNKR